MFKKTILPVVLMLLGSTAYTSADAVEQTIGCRLKGGSLVQLAAETCAMEGGTPVIGAMPVPAPTSTNVAPAPVEVKAASFQSTGDPKLDAAQQTVIELLNRTVVEKNSRKSSPEGVERTTKFDGCRLIVDENMHVDHGNLFSSRMNFKISSTIDLRNISRTAFGVMGKVASIGGGMKTQAVYFDEPKHSSGNNISISVLQQRDEEYKKFTLPGLAAYWDAPDDDFWMADEYGYPKHNNMEDIATDHIRILFLMSTADDAAALNKALDDVHALCKP